MNTKIAICACSSRTFIDKQKVAQVAAAAREAGMVVTLVSDLCELCEDKCEEVHAIAQTTVLACHERAVKSLLAFVGEDTCQCVDIRGGSTEDVLKALGVTTAIGATVESTPQLIAEYQEQIAAMPRKLGEDAWYPTLDKDQCAECGKCLEFCPFGVYEMIEDRIRVVHPHHCKNNCPACARTCPAGAIIFPKYDRSPINGGEEKQENAIKLDTTFDSKQNAELYGQTLRERLASRKKILK